MAGGALEAVPGLHAVIGGLGQILEPSLPEPPGAGALLVRSLLVLLGVCAAAWLLVRLLRRALPPLGSGPLVLLARLPLDGRRVVYVVRAGARVLVVGAGEGGGLATLAELGADEVAALGPAPTPTSFRDVMARIRGGARAVPPEPPGPPPGAS